MRFVLKYIRGNKIKSFFIYFSFLVCIAIIIISNSLIETISNIETLQKKYQNSPYNIIIASSNSKQYSNIEKDKNISNLGLENFIGVSKDEKYLYQVIGTNYDNLLSTSKFIVGNFFQKKNDIILEKWTLEYLGLKPNINQEVNVVYKNEKGNIINEKCNICGIINDIPANKNIGLKVIYKDINFNKSNKFKIKLEYKKGTDLYSVLNRYEKKYGIDKRNIIMNASSPEEMNENLSTSLDINNIFKGIVFSILCILIIYSIINMSIRERIKIYSLIKALGANKFFVFKSILYELVILYISAIPLGFLINDIFTKAVVRRIKFINTENIYLHNSTANLNLIVNNKQIFFSLLVMLLFVVIISFLIYIKIKNNNIVSGIITSYNLKKKYKFTRNIYLNYIIKDISTILIMVVTLSMLSSYFLLIRFNDYLSAEQEKMMVWDMYSYSDIKVAATDNDLNKSISREDLNKLKKVDGIKSIDHSRLIPGKIILQDQWKVNNKYFSNLNENSKDNYWKEYMGTNKNLHKRIVKGSVRAYNDDSFKQLKNFKTSGNFNLEALKKGNNAILVIPKTDKNNFKNLPYGENVIDIKVGDTLKIMTPKSKIIENSYYNLNDDFNKYKINQFKVVGIAYGSYFENTRERTNPSLNIIITDNKFNDIYKTYDYRNLNIYMSNGYNIDNLYKEVDKVFIGRKNIITRNVRSETNQISQINSRKTVFSISVIVSLVVAILFFAANSISSLYEINKNDILTIRKLGASKNQIYKILILEWILLSVLLISGTFVLSKLSQDFVYYSRGISYEGIKNIYNYTNFIGICLVNIIPLLLVLFYKTNRSKN